MLLENLPSNSRLWFFGAQRVLTESEIQSLSTIMSTFVASWTAHGAKLLADFTIQHEAILIVGVDESAAPPTGCSIDKVFQLLLEFKNNTGVDFFQRTLIWEAFCNTTEIYDIQKAIDALHTGRLRSNTLVVNPLISHLNQARESMYIPLNESWVATKLGLK